MNESKNKFRIIGIMSGTSHDGVDVAAVEIDSPNVSRAASTDRADEIPLNISIIKHLHIPYSRSLRSEISNAFTGTTYNICRLNFKLGEVFSKAVLSLLQKSKFKKEDIDAIASHGQTVYHIPPAGRKHGSTLQIGEASVIAERTGILTISDFRTRDMAAGGQGAPLVPLADYLLFWKKRSIRAILNIGGIANVTIVKEKINDTVAFDIGPGNSLIDEAMKLYSGGKKSFDRNGSFAKSGRPDKWLLNELLAHPYFKKKHPKSTGREMFGAEMVKNIFARYGNLKPADIVSTLTYLTAIRIVRAILPFKPHEIIATGGGIKNRFLMETIHSLLKDDEITVSSISDYGIPPDAKEAVSFAILGYRTLLHLHGNLPSATGARREVILGKITLTK